MSRLVDKLIIVVRSLRVSSLAALVICAVSFEVMAFAPAPPPAVGFWSTLTHAVRLECDWLLAKVTRPWRRPPVENPVDRALRTVEEEYQDDLGLFVAKSGALPPGVVRGKFRFGRHVGFQYNPGPGEASTTLGDLQALAKGFAEIQRLTTAGVDFKISRVGNEETIMWIRSIRPTGDDPFVKWWAKQIHRHGLKFHFYSLPHETRKSMGGATRDWLYVRPDLLGDPETYREVLVHEAVHGRHWVIADQTKQIVFEPDDYDPKTDRGTPMPGAPRGYETHLVSGELEAQCIGAARGHLRNRTAVWRRCRAFTIQLEWLLTLRRQLDNGEPASTRHVIDYEGVSIAITFQVSDALDDARAISREVRSTVDERIRELRNIIRISDGRAESRPATL